ncbi:RidA family protein [Pedobacter sp. SYP-B3415]|uniref:RidA family protein n=1 Tax=Pedobacter sp. SYP-B3415 TaxID=2496641 RepID=UPI00101D58D1|nr:RidA family protein [Pedobacter sp. SYP-B3415]
MKKIIQTKNAPAPIGPYSQAVQTGNLLFVSGQIAINPETEQLNITSIEEETHQVMRNIKAILLEAGLDFSHVIKASIFLTDMGNFPRVNETYASYFSSDFPARETVEVSVLPKNVNVEISVIAATA